MARRGWEQLQRRGRGLAEEAKATVRTGRQLDPAWLDSAEGWPARVAPVWPDVAAAQSAARRYRLIASSSSMEAWLIDWPSTGRLELHDHGGDERAPSVLPSCR